MATGLIGYTGLVGSTLLRQTSFDELYNSSNIGQIAGRKFDLLVCAGAPAEKWKANQEPQNDLQNLQNLMASLSEVEARRLVLISTVDVYDRPVLVNEDTPIRPSNLQPYGKHRFLLEEFIRNRFASFNIVRLPGLFGAGLKKNFIFDLMNHRCLDLTHGLSRFQFYNLAHLWAHLQISMANNLSTVNFATEPVSAIEVARRCFGLDFITRTQNEPARYDMRTRFAELFGRDGGYLLTARETLEQIRLFAKSGIGAEQYEAVNV